MKAPRRTNWIICWRLYIIFCPGYVEKIIINYAHLVTPWVNVGQVDKDTRIVYWRDGKEDREKRIDRLKAGSADRRLEALSTLFTTTAALLRDLSNINLLKTDSRLTVIASQLISEPKPLVVVVVVVHDIFLSLYNK